MPVYLYYDFLAMKHTILGAGGAVGNALTYELLKKGEKVRLVSRRGYSIAGTESYKADITSYDETLGSIRNSDIVYLCAGLPYDSKLWAELWPRIMQNTIDACKSINARLVFFDNVYMYGKVRGKMVESTQYNPCSRKGEIRAKISSLLEDEIYKKNLNALIARSADFYGPYAEKTSLLHILVIDKLMKGKRALWMIDDSVFHSFTYTLDIAKAIVLLSGTEECYNQVWHLPTSDPAEGQTFIHIVANNLMIAPDYTVMDKWMLKFAGLFDKNTSESAEMAYQYETNYFFDSTKFNEYFNYTPLHYYNGIQETIEYLRESRALLIA